MGFHEIVSPIKHIGSTRILSMLKESGGKGQNRELKRGKHNKHRPAHCKAPHHKGHGRGRHDQGPHHHHNHDGQFRKLDIIGTRMIRLPSRACMMVDESKATNDEKAKYGKIKNMIDNMCCNNVWMRCEEGRVNAEMTSYDGRVFSLNNADKVNSETTIDIQDDLYPEYSEAVEAVPTDKLNLDETLNWLKKA